MTIAKHEVVKAPRKGTTKQPQPQPPQQPVIVTGPGKEYPHSTPSIQHDINHVAGLAGIEESLDALTSAVSRITGADQAIGLTTGHGIDPVKITLVDDIYEDGPLATLTQAVARIADSLAKIAGLNRPRLERWNESSKWGDHVEEWARTGER